MTRFPKFVRLYLLPCIVLFTSANYLLGLQTNDYRAWTSKEGTQVEARIFSSSGDQFIFITPVGKKYSATLDQLSAKDIEFLRSLQSTSSQPEQATPLELLPLSDPSNQGNWVLNTEVSDEFEDQELDEERWYIVGKFENGKPFYKHPDLPNKKVWIGRAPSQFSGRNYRLEDGKLILETRWEPDFPFSEELGKPWGPGGKNPSIYKDITTACIIGRRFFKYGYMEIRSKAADAEITSSFWSIGKGLEIDMFEQFGDGRNKNKDHLDSELWWSIRDWKRFGGKPTYTERKQVGFRVADDFHTYGFDWSEEGIKYYIDGKLFTEVSADEIRKHAKKEHGLDDGYVATIPISIWIDQETFPWHGVPDSKEDLELNSPAGEKDDGVVDFEIEYVRVWQKQ